MDRAKAEAIERIRSQYSLERLKQMLDKFRNLKILVIGDAIIDEYHFTTPKGRAVKDPILSVDYIKHEAYAGGVFAIANHLSDFADSVTLLTMLGDRDDRKDFIANALNKNIVTKFFVKQNSPTTVKKRYLNALRNEKLFKVEYLNDAPISEELERSILNFLIEELPKFDLVVVGDFGHSLITENMINVLEGKSNYITVNVQSNSANLGFNFVTKYKSPNYVTMDIPELQYAVSDRFNEVPVLAAKLYAKTRFKKFLVTMGGAGAGYFNAGRPTFFPAFASRPLDVVGAGDAVFSITSLLAYCNYDELIPFIANCVGGIAVSYMGNKEYITKKKLLDFIEQVYNGDVHMQ
ncbi:hypothetical protein HYV83_00640 [Candidatus Woesearchaeota archaeon]|nr:hypothetical protein [Candidatus Woesearchaeota archaeon]